jgi:hypothetical protein
MKPERRYYGNLRKALNAFHNKYELQDSLVKGAFWNRTLRNMFPRVQVDPLCRQIKARVHFLYGKVRQ